MTTLTTADLPRDMQYDPDPVVRRGALSIECKHGDRKCPPCIREAAASLAPPTGVS